ncbi:MAG: hypothetical protein ACOH1N_08870 [Lutibacter sp.]
MIETNTSKDFLESWTFSSQEWNAFVNEAKLLKKEDNIFMGIATFLVGIPFLMLVRNATLFMATLVVIPFAILIPWLRNKISTSYLKPIKNEAIVNFYTDYISINEKKIDLFANKKWIKNIIIIDGKNGLKLLVIDIAWRTRKGDTFDETRIPIPTDKLERAEALIEFYRFYK